MGIDSPVNLPIDDSAIRLLTDMTSASLTGDVEKLRVAVEEYVALAPERRLEFEQLISMVMPPWILPMQMFQIFSDPEQFIGAFSRLGGSEGAAVAATMADATAASIVLAAVANWLQNEQDIALVAKNEAKTEQSQTGQRATSENRSSERTVASEESSETEEATTEEPIVIAESEGEGETTAVTTAASNAPAAPKGAASDTSEGIPAGNIGTTGTGQSSGVEEAPPIVSEGEAAPTVQASTVRSDNPINAALSAYINTGGTGGPIDAAQSIQFLRNNPILLAGLHTVDPALLVKAYQIAESEIIVGLLDKIIEMQAQIRDEQKRYDAMKEAQRPTPTQDLLHTIHHGIHDKTIPLNQSTLMVIQLLLMNAAAMQVGAITPAAEGVGIAANVEASANVTAIVSSQAGLAVAKTHFPNDAVATSVLVSIPNVFANEQQQITSPETIIQMGLMAAIYAQMVPYWSIPAAISFQETENANGNGQKGITESAVRAFAVAVGTMIQDPAFNLLIQTIILNNAPDPSRITPEQIKTYTAAMKIALLANAAVALYTVILKKTPEEIAQLLGIPVEDALGLQFSPERLVDIILGRRDAPLPEDPLLRGLLQQIQAYLDEMPEANREDFLKDLFGSYSEGFSVEDLVNPSTQFLRLCDQTLFHEHTTETSV